MTAVLSLGRRPVLISVSIGAMVLVAITLLAMRPPADVRPPAAVLSPHTAFIEAPPAFDPGVRYWSRSAWGETFVLADGRLMHSLPERAVTGGAGKRRTWALIENMRGSRTLQLLAQQPAEDSVTVISPGAGTRTDLATFDRIVMPEAWAGIDVALHNARDGVERIYTVQPGASPRRIDIALDGATDLHVTDEGDLAVSTGVGELRYRRPIAFQLDAQGERESVSVEYRIGDDGKSFGFDVGSYDSTRPLIIDPILQATYFGAELGDIMQVMAIDPLTSDVLVAGFWRSSAEPEWVGGFQPTAQTQGVIITRFDRSLERIKQTTMFGGPVDEFATAIAIDPVSGEVFLSGMYDGGYADLPGSGSGIEPAPSYGTFDGFVTRFSRDLRRLEQMTYFGGERGVQRPNAIAIDPTTHEVYVAGEGVGGAILVRYDPTLDNVLSRTAVEGNVLANAFGVAINPATHDVYMLGVTSSRVFPKLSGGAFSDSTQTGYFTRMFVARFDRTLATHYQSTFVANGNTTSAGPKPILIHPNGDVFVCGQALGDVGSLPGAARPNFGGVNFDAFIARFSPDLTVRRAATYFGGEHDTQGESIALSPDGTQLYLGGTTFSRHLIGSNETGDYYYHPYAARLDVNLTSVGSVILAGGSVATGPAIAVDSVSGEVFQTGFTNWPTIRETRGGQQPEWIHSIYNGDYESFVSRYDPMLSNASDTTPDAFTIPAQSGVALSSTVTSAPVRISGVTEAVPISVSNGEYSIDGAAFTNAASTISRAQVVRVRHVSAATQGVDTQTVLTVGGAGHAFTSTTESGTDTTPDLFTFDAQSSAALSKTYETERVTITGTNTPVPVNVTNGEYSIDDQPFRSTPSTIYSGQSIAVRAQSSADLATMTITTLSIGTRLVYFFTTTEAVDVTPRPFRFKPKPNARADSDWPADSLIVTGLTAPAPISITGGTLQTWDSDGMHDNPSTVRNLAAVRVTVHTGQPGSTTSATLTIGGVSTTFQASVRPPLAANQVPAAFSIPPVSGADAQVWVESAPVTLTGFSAPSPIQFVDELNVIAKQLYIPEWNAFANGGPDYLDNGTMIAPGTPLRLRVKPQFFGRPSSVTVDIGGRRATFTVNVRSNDAVPGAFNFADIVNATPGAVLSSETLTLTGFDSPAALTATGCTASVNNGTNYVSQGTVNPGDPLVLRIVASSSSGTATTCTVTVGGISDTVTVTTSGTAPNPPPGGGSSSGGNNGGGGGGGGGAFDWLTLIMLSTLAAAMKRAATARGARTS